MCCPSEEQVSLQAASGSPTHQQVGDHTLQAGVVVAHLCSLAEQRHRPRLRTCTRARHINPTRRCCTSWAPARAACASQRCARQGSQGAGPCTLGVPRGCKWGAAGSCLGFLQLGAAHERAQQDGQQRHAARLVLPALGSRQVKVRVPRPHAAPLLHAPTKPASVSRRNGRTEQSSIPHGS